MAEAELVVRRASLETDLAREEAAEMRAVALGAATEARTAEVEAGVSRREARDARAQGQLELSELREAGLVELLAGDGYRLTPLGRELMESFQPLHHFAERWSKRVTG